MYVVVVAVSNYQSCWMLAYLACPSYLWFLGQATTLLSKPDKYGWMITVMPPLKYEWCRSRLYQTNKQDIRKSALVMQKGYVLKYFDTHKQKGTIYSIWHYNSRLCESQDDIHRNFTQIWINLLPIHFRKRSWMPAKYTTTSPNDVTATAVLYWLSDKDTLVVC